MATVKFQLLNKNKKETQAIYLRLSINRGVAPRTTTGLSISINDWSIDKGLPKQTTSYNKNTATKLCKLKDYIIDKYNDASANGTTINTNWLKHNIDVHFKRINEDKRSELLTDAIQTLLDEAVTRKNAKGGIGLSKSRINSYVSLQNIITEYQKNNSYKVKDVNVLFAKDFLKYLLNTKGYQKSYAFKKISDLKTVCYDASFYGIETSPQLKAIASTKPKNDNILYLTPIELKAIEQANLINEAHKNARKWLLLGCSLGQRGGDLLQLNKDNFVTRNGYEVIELKQQKTAKNVVIPVLENTKEIIKKGLPYKISIQKFNKYIKEVCEIAEINDMIQGTKITVTVKDKGNKEKRKISGVYPKWQLMASHVCRRTFATNLYGTLPTPLIMSITAHGTEKMLLNYIGKDSLDFAQQIADFYTLQAIKQKKEPHLKVVNE